MSPNSAERSPLSPVEANILPLTAEPPPLELPEPIKGRSGAEDAELRPPELDRVDSTDEGTQNLMTRCSVGSGGAILQASDEQTVTHVPLPRSSPIACALKEEIMDAEPPVRLASSAPPCDPAMPTALFGDDDDEAHGAVQALLALQRDDSPCDLRQRASSLPSTFTIDACPSSPPSPESADDSPTMRPTAMPKPGQAQAARFYCRFPRCGKGYASTDAVRKHCRQRHLEWLRRLGHGCPALYCRWEE